MTAAEVIAIRGAAVERLAWLGETPIMPDVVDSWIDTAKDTLRTIAMCDAWLARKGYRR